MSNPTFTAPNYTTQAAATYKANIDAAIAANGADAINLGFSYSAGTFTVHGHDGTALSASNPGFIRFQSKGSPGQYTYISIEANQSFVDDAAASEILGNLFATTTGVAWASDMPFFVYGVANDAMTSVQLMLSRVPHATQTPASTAIGAPDDAVADENYSFWSFDSIDETLYDLNPCTCIGSIRMQKSSADDWTVQALSVRDGVGRFQDETTFTMPEGHMGAASGSNILTNSGTVPAFTTSSVAYTLSRSGDVKVSLDLRGDGGTDGVGARNVFVAVPFANDEVGTTGSFLIDKAGTNEIYISLFQDTEDDVDPATGQQAIKFVRYDGLLLELEDFINNDRSVYGSITYKASVGA